MTNEIPAASGIYIATIKSEVPMPITRDRRCVDTCARVNNKNVKIGKAENLSVRRKNFWKDFDEENVVFMPIALLDETVAAKKLI